MSFERTQRHLKRMEEGELTACELFACFYDLCEDMKAASGGPISKLPTGDVDKLVRPLGRIAKTVTTAAVRVEDPDWKQTILDLARENETISTQCDAAAAELEKLEKSKKEQQKLLTSLQETVDAQTLRKAELVTLTDALAGLTAQQEAARAEIAALEEKLNQYGPKEEEERKLKALEQSRDEKQTLLDSQTALLSGQAEKRREIAALDEKLKASQAKVDKLVLDLAQYEDQKKLKEDLDDLAKQKANDLAERKRLSGQLTTLRAECSTARTKRDNMTKSVNDTKAEREKLDRELVELKEKVAILNTGLARYADKREEKKRLETLRKQKAADLQTYQGLETSIQTLNADISKLGGKLKELTGQKEELETERGRLADALETQEKALKLAEEAISPEELACQQARLARLTRALEGLEKERRELCESFPELGDCREYPNMMHMVLKQIKKLLSECEENYRAIIAVLESKKES